MKTTKDDILKDLSGSIPLSRELLTVDEYARREGISCNQMEKYIRLGVVNIRKFKNRRYIISHPVGSSPFGDTSDEKFDSQRNKPATDSANLAMAAISNMISTKSPFIDESPAISENRDSSDESVEMDSPLSYEPLSVKEDDNLDDIFESLQLDPPAMPKTSVPPAPTKNTQSGPAIFDPHIKSTIAKAAAQFSAMHGSSDSVSASSFVSGSKFASRPNPNFSVVRHDLATESVTRPKSTPRVQVSHQAQIAPQAKFWSKSFFSKVRISFSDLFLRLRLSVPNIRLISISASVAFLLSISVGLYYQSNLQSGSILKLQSDSLDLMRTSSLLSQRAEAIYNQSSNELASLRSSLSSAKSELLALRTKFNRSQAQLSGTTAKLSESEDSLSLLRQRNREAIDRLNQHISRLSSRLNSMGISSSSNMLDSVPSSSAFDDPGFEAELPSLIDQIP